MLDLLNSSLMMLQSSALGDVVRNARYLYPVLEAIHIIGIALLVGPAFTFDFRLLGVGHRTVSVTTAARYLLPVSHAGLAIAATTGVALLTAQATVIAGAGAAPWKFGLLILAGLNVAVFHGGIYRSVDKWTDVAVAPIRPHRGSNIIDRMDGHHLCRSAFSLHLICGAGLTKHQIGLQSSMA
jgi:hypothetical protein